MGIKKNILHNDYVPDDEKLPGRRVSMMAGNDDIVYDIVVVPDSTVVQINATYTDIKNAYLSGKNIFLHEERTEEDPDEPIEWSILGIEKILHIEEVGEVGDDNSFSYYVRTINREYYTRNMNGYPMADI